VPGSRRQGSHALRHESKHAQKLKPPLYSAA
jgi:hypothetical protein